MNLMKWFRKNNTKVMAIVVIIIMLCFVAGPALRSFGRMRIGLHGAIAYYGEDRKISRDDVILANRELEILRELRVDVLLRSQDLRAVLLGELLFSERRVSPVIINRIKQAITSNELRISDKQIGDIYRRSLPVDYYWLLLKNEARLAGVRIAKVQAGNLLAQVIPQLFDGLTYSERIGDLVGKQGIPEDQILATFGELLAVLQYAHMICSSENVTSSQLVHLVSWGTETIDVEFVEFDSSVFAETLAEPNDDMIIEHFDKYKKFFASTLSEENPYCFGYKLPDRVQLEYMAVKLDDVSSIVAPPTHQEKEEYYQRNIQRFTVSVPLDPNDPNSQQTKKTISYAEVESDISRHLLQEKINSRAEAILQEAKALTDADLEDVNIEPEKLTSEQLRLRVGDYKTAAEKLSEKHSIKIYPNRTGLLSASDIQNDKNLGMLFLRSYGYKPVGLVRIVFAIDELKASELGLFEIQKPRMYENIGPLRDMFGQMMVLVRVIRAELASEPESINQTFSTNTLILDPNQQQSENAYSLREEVTGDLKRLEAMDIARSKAEEFIDLVSEDGWDSALDRFNELYGQQAGQNPNDPNTFQLQSLTGLLRPSNLMLETLKVQNAGNPTAQFFTGDVIQQRGQFIEQLYSLVPQDSNTVDSVPLIMKFKPYMSFYVIKDISLERLDEMEYERLKTTRLYREDYVQLQSMAAVFLNPENILKRMKFKVAEDIKPVDANATVESEGAS